MHTNVIVTSEFFTFTFTFICHPGKTHKLRSEYIRGNFLCLRFVKRSLDKSVHVHSRAHKMLRDLTEAGNAPPFGSHVDPPTVMWLALRTAA